MNGGLRIDDARLVTLLVTALMTAALWLAAWSMVGSADLGVVAICRAALTGAPLPAGAEADLAALSALLARPGAGLFAVLWAMWTLMMAAMMLPAMTSMLATYADIARLEHRGALLALRIGLFAGAYLSVWAAFSGVAALAQMLARGGPLLRLDGETAAPATAGALLIIAGLYQFSRIKQACLTKCRHPMQFLMAGWRPGLQGAAAIGLRHGLHCLGCCVALMALMFVFGAMNLWWMAAIALYCVAERIAPGAETWGKYAGVAMIVGGFVMFGTLI